MEPVFNLMKKRRPSLGDCGVKPLNREVHGYLLSGYLMWPVITALSVSSVHPLAILGVFVSFIVLGFLFYNLLVAMVQMSHNEKKRLHISQWIFCVSVFVLVLRIALL